MSISKLSEGAGVSRQAITKHLQVMEEARLVRSRRQGRERVWRLERRRVNEARRYLDLISTQWDDALERLRRFVEN
jgi:DNA-binding transcriptional ArsR family regulator